MAESTSCGGFSSVELEKTWPLESSTCAKYITGIKLVLQETGLDILAITETKLAANITEDEIGMDGYFVVRKDRDRNGGGVLIYYKDLLTA